MSEFTKLERVCFLAITDSFLNVSADVNFGRYGTSYPVCFRSFMFELSSNLVRIVERNSGANLARVVNSLDSFLKSNRSDCGFTVLSRLESIKLLFEELESLVQARLKADSEPDPICNDPLMAFLGFPKVRK